MRAVPDPLFMLAFDHRQVLRDLYGRAAEPRFGEVKTIVVDALSHAVVSGVTAGNAALLVDEEYGAGAARTCRERGLLLAMPVEASRTASFELQYGEDFAAHVDAFSPDLVKALVFHNPDDAPERKRQQLGRLAALDRWIHDHGHRLLLEVLVPPSERQAAAVGGDTDRFRAEMLPALIGEAVTECREAGIDPAVWKLEGLESPDAYRTVAERVRDGGRDDARCIVLGSGAELHRVERWVKAAAEVTQFSGFAVGRSVWVEPLGAYLRGELERDGAVVAVSEGFASLVAAFGRV